ncbi:chemotaxis protein CheA [Pseudomonas sp. 31-12]|uniref:chemotaxis protein CheA n=1 Tax=Pseudomonas sp. 31-12 TaxID=2201356 RepID=UPI000D6DBAD4|nr:chemotaxis protein CheA [Pseudomonas sp. 31-12]AWM93731.1 chemotaxis protein CheA [Pseudomonas sp. 31-12]
MNPLLQQFLEETRDFLQGIAERLMQLESEPDSRDLINELFRMVHTLKGNSGLFDFPEMTRVLHAGEDVMDAVRDGRLTYSRELADRLLDAMDFVGQLTDQVEQSGSTDPQQANIAAALAADLRELLGVQKPLHAEAAEPAQSAVEDAKTEVFSQQALALVHTALSAVPESVRMEVYRSACQGSALHWVEYNPLADCFFNGEDPLHQVRQIPQVIWQRVLERAHWAPLLELDAYNCNLCFQLLTQDSQAHLMELFRYTPEQLDTFSVPAVCLIIAQGEPNSGPVYADFMTDALAALQQGDRETLVRVTRTLLELSAPDLWLSSALRWLMLILDVHADDLAVASYLIRSLESADGPDWAAYLAQAKTQPQRHVEAPSQAITEATAQAAARASAEPEMDVSLRQILIAQHSILSLSDAASWLPGRLQAVAASLAGCLAGVASPELLAALDAALEQSLEQATSGPLRDWLTVTRSQLGEPADDQSETAVLEPVLRESTAAAAAPAEAESRFGRRAEDVSLSTTLKVDQAKIDRLMALIGEMVVAKNSLPYLASRAEHQHGVRDLAREIKAQYAVINRIAEEMQDSIMQVRMLPVSSVFQRFPRLIRDISRKLGKEVSLELIGEDTEADKNIIESLADPLIHILRNSLDHGIELPAERIRQGKPAGGRLEIRASQEADRVLIQISDDGKGIDPAVIKAKAYEKGLLDETALERLSDADAVNLVFAAGFSTCEAVSDLSGRGVGMDVVRSAIERVNGSVRLESQVGKGTRIVLSLPLSMAVSSVMVVESYQQVFGVPMDCVVETVRVPRNAIRNIKQHRTAILRGQVIPLLDLNQLLDLSQAQLPNLEDEFATLVVRHQGEPVGIIVDDFRETVDIILKPLAGILGQLPGYSGSALLGDGSILMVLNPQELF